MKAPDLAEQVEDARERRLACTFALGLELPHVTLELALEHMDRLHTKEGTRPYKASKTDTLSAEPQPNGDQLHGTRMPRPTPSRTNPRNTPAPLHTSQPATNIEPPRSRRCHNRRQQRPTQNRSAGPFRPTPTSRSGRIPQGRRNAPHHPQEEARKNKN